MTEVPHPTDATKEASPPQHAATEAALKMAADSTKAAASKPTDLAHKAQELTGEIGAAISSGMTNAAHFLSGALDYLPNLHLTDSAAAKPAAPAAPAAKPETAKPAAAAQNDHAAKPESHVTQIASTVALTAVLGPAGMMAGAVASSASSFDMTKAFAKVDTTNKQEKYSLGDYLKSTGCSSGDSCKVSDGPASSSLDLGGGLLNVTSTATRIDTGKSQTSEISALTEEQWRDVTHTIKGEQWLPTFKPDDDDRRSTKVADGFVHRDRNGRIDFERHGDIETRHNPSGTTTEYNVRTHEKVLKDKNGKVVFTFGDDGFKGTTADGTQVEFAPLGRGVKITKDGRTTVTTFEHGVPKTTVGNTDITTSDESLLASIGVAPIKIDGMLDGHSQIKVYADSKVITSPDGSTMFVGNDGTSAMSLDAHSQVVRYPGKDGAPDRMVIMYNDGRKPVELSQAAIAKLYKELGGQAVVLKAVMDRLRAFGQTGVLDDGKGNKLQTAADGTITASTADAAADTRAQTLTVTDKKDGTQQVIDVANQTVQLVGRDGTAQGVIDFKGNQPAFKTDTYEYRDGHVRTADGDDYSNQGIHFADGTIFEANGVIRDQVGHTYNAEGEPAIPGEKSSSSRSSGDSSSSGEASKAKAQVSQAEGMASSIRARAASGHISASDVAALYGEMSALSAMVAGLAQHGDLGLVAEAMKAKDEIADSLSAANATLGEKHERRALLDNMASAANTVRPLTAQPVSMAS